MSRRNLAPVLIVLAVAFAGAAVLSTRAQEPAKAAASVPVGEALPRPYAFAFAKDTPIRDVAERLRQTLGVRVVIDQAALDRLGIDDGETVKLVLDGVRLKVGLKLMLDQLRMTYRVEPDDNLLILTDASGASDPIDRVLTEIKALHRDVHDVQDALDELRLDLGLDGEDDGPKMRKPTIIEEKPGDKPAEKPDDPAKPAKPRHSGA